MEKQEFDSIPATQWMPLVKWDGDECTYVCPFCGKELKWRMYGKYDDEVTIEPCKCDQHKLAREHNKNVPAALAAARIAREKLEADLAKIAQAKDEYSSAYREKMLKDIEPYSVSSKAAREKLKADALLAAVIAAREKLG